MQPESTDVLATASLVATAETIAEQQLPNGMILWFPGGHTDTWNHTESAMALDVAGLHQPAEKAYQWLLDTQSSAGSWDHYHLADGIEDAKVDTNCCAYVVTGVLHHWVLTGDKGFAETMWPAVERTIDFVVGLQDHRGIIPWAVHADGTPWSYGLLTGSSSTYHSILCALTLADALGAERPHWELAAIRLADLIAHHADMFEPKHRWAMDWYYPALCGAMSTAAATTRLQAGRDRFFLEDKGIKCVSDQPWVTAAETCECALAHLRVGNTSEARRLFDSVEALRDDDGAYFTGLVHPDGILFPDAERSTYSSAAVILAADALDKRTPASGLLLGQGLRDLHA